MWKALALSAVVVLAACSTPVMKPIDEGVEKVDRQVSAAAGQVQSGDPLLAYRKSPIKYVDEVWLPVSKVGGEDSSDPRRTESLGREVAVNRYFTDINEVAAYISSLTGIPASVTPEATKGSGGTEGKSDGAADEGAVPPVSPDLSMTAAGLGLGGGASAAALPVVYKGQLSGLLDLVAARYNLFWEWNKTGITFLKTKSQTFRIAALPGDTSLTSKVGAKSGGSGSESGASSSSSSSKSDSEQQVGVEFSSMSVWKGIEDSIKTMLTKDGRLTVTPATGTVTVDDTPVVLERVGRFIAEQNAALSRQVVVNVRVLSVDLTDSHEYGINWDMVYENVGKSLGVSLSNSFTSDTDATNLTFNVLSGSMWEDSSAIIDALSTQGRVSQVTSASMVTINNQPVPIQVGRQTSYLAASTTTIGTGGAGNTVSLTPGQVTTGFSMSVLPHILDGKKMMLQYTGDISSLIDIDSASSGGSSIQTPILDTRNFLQRVILNSGETLVVTGFEQFDLNGNTQGVGNARNIAAGGGVTTNDGRNVLVVLIQPVLSGSRE